MSITSDATNSSLRLNRKEVLPATPKATAKSADVAEKGWELLDEDGRFLRWAVGLILSIFGWAGLAMGGAMALFTTKTGPYIGTNGLLGWSVVFLTIGGWLLWEQRNLESSKSDS